MAIDNKTPIDTTLASNAFTAYVPNIPVLSRVSHWLQSAASIVKSAYRCLCSSKPIDKFQRELRPPNSEARPGLNDSLFDENDFVHEDLSKSQQVKIKSDESDYASETLPMLPASERIQASKYLALTEVTTAPHKRNVKLAECEAALQYNATSGESVVDDAFLTEFVNDAPLLPDSIKNSSLLNQDSDKKTGEISNTKINALVDQSTGFAATLFYDKENKELIVTFAEANSFGISRWKSAGRAFLSWLGFVPKTYSQASKLTQMLQTHLKEHGLSDEVKLTLTGRGYGGAAAEYAALRNKAAAVAFNPIHLGNGSRARIGQSRLDEAHKYVTEVVVHKSMYADNKWSWIYAPFRAIGMRNMGSIGTSNRFMLPFRRSKTQQGSDRVAAHRDIMQQATWWKNNAESLENIKAKIPCLNSDDVETIADERIEDPYSDIFRKKLGSLSKKSTYDGLIKALADYTKSVGVAPHSENTKSAFQALDEKLKELQQKSQPDYNAMPINFRKDLKAIIENGHAYKNEFDDNVTLLNGSMDEQFYGDDYDNSVLDDNRA